MIGKISAKRRVQESNTMPKITLIGAGSVVVKDIPPFTVAVGNPCRPIKRWNPENQQFERI